MTVATADQVARFTGSSTNWRSARMPPKANTSTAVVVSRGSQSHHTPQVGLAQIEPCMQSSADEHDARPRPPPRGARPSCQPPRKSETSAQAKANVSASIAFQAVGTWTYMMRCTSPM